MKRLFWVALSWGAVVVGFASSLSADIGLSLAYVDMGGQPYARFKTFVDQAVAGNPGYAFSATDAA
ncbi:MAG: hypothetical protein KBA72_07615, partial [Thermoanaerobaculia bacterium]|nr:hypothetical protein [Thermoanaerobaculia bacterium]